MSTLLAGLRELMQKRAEAAAIVAACDGELAEVRAALQVPDGLAATAAAPAQTAADVRHGKQMDRVLAALSDEPSTAHDVARVTGLPSNTCSSWLSQLVMRGLAIEAGMRPATGPSGGRPTKLFRRAPAETTATASDAYAEKPCEGCGKPVKWLGRKHPRCPDCQIRAGQERFTGRLEHRRERHNGEASTLARVASAPAQRDVVLEAADKVTAAVTEARDAAILRYLGGNNGVALFKALVMALPKNDPATTVDARTAAVKASLLRLRATKKVERTGDTWSLVGAGLHHG